MAISENQNSLFRILKKFDSDKGLSSVDIVELSGNKLNKATAKYNLYEWLDTGVVERIGRGKYRLRAGASKADNLGSILTNTITVPDYYHK